jgi:hypothetical protein
MELLDAAPTTTIRSKKRRSAVVGQLYTSQSVASLHVMAGRGPTSSANERRLNTSVIRSSCVDLGSLAVCCCLPIPQSAALARV